MDDSHFDGLSSLVRLSGSNVPARARFIGEAILSSTMTGLTLGLVFGRVGGLTVAGPLVPFLVGTWTGYTFGLVGHWRNCKRLAITVENPILEKFDLEVADRRSRYQPRKKCPNRWRSHLL